MAHPESLDASGFDPDVLAKHAQFVRRLARGLVRDGDAAEELTARTFAAAVERRPDTGPGFRVWLERVTWRLFLRDRRDRERRDRRERVAASPEPTRPTVDLVAELDLQRRIARAFEELAEPSKSALYLRYFRDLGPGEIAEQLQVPVSTVKSRLQRGLEALRERLDALHEGRRDAWLQALLPWIGGPLVATKVKVVPVAVAALLLVGLGVGGFEVLRRTTAPRATPAHAESAVASAESAAAAKGADAAPKDATPTRESVEGVRVLPFAAGVVVDEAGAPLADVSVVASRLRRNDGGGDRITQDPLRLDRYDRDRLATTDASGRFVVAEPGVDLVALSFLRDGYASDEWAELSAERAKNQDHRVVLHAAVAFRGRVVDRERKPVESARVTLIPVVGEQTGSAAGERSAAHLPGSPTYLALSGWQLTLSDANGTFTFGSPAAATYRVSVMAAGYAFRPDVRPPTANPYEVVLVRNAIIVDVRDSDSRVPLRAALVVTDPKSGAVLDQAVPWLPKDVDHSVVAPPGQLCVHTGFGESFRRAEVPWAGSGRDGGVAVALHVLAADHVGQALDVTLQKDEEPPHLEVELEPDDGAARAPMLEGRVVGAKRAELRAYCLIPNHSEPYLEANEPLVAVHCDDDGHFELFDLPAARYRLFACAEGVAPAFVDVAAPARDVTIELHPAAGLEVSVKNRAGAPVPGAVVHVQRPDGSRAWYAKSAADGVATFETLTSGALLVGAFEDMRYDLVDPTVCFPLTRKAFTDATVVGVKSGERVRVERALVERLTTRLRFTRDDGRPVEHLKMEFSGFDGPVQARYREWDRLRALAPELDANGEATVDLDPGDYSFRVSDDGPTGEAKFTVPSADGGPVAIVVPSLRESGTIVGRVVDAVTGRPIARRKVYAMPRRNGSNELEPELRLTDDDGRFRFEKSPTGPTRVAIYAGEIGNLERYFDGDPTSPYGYGSQECVVERDRETALEFTLPPIKAKDASFPTIALDARVTDAASGAPLEKATLVVHVRVATTDVEVAQATTDADGHLAANVFAGDIYRIDVYGPYPGGDSRSSPFQEEHLELAPMDGVLRVEAALVRRR